MKQNQKIINKEKNSKTRYKPIGTVLNAMAKKIIAEAFLTEVCIYFENHRMVRFLF